MKQSRGIVEMNPFDGSNKETQAQERACERAQGGPSLEQIFVARRQACGYYRDDLNQQLREKPPVKQFFTVVR